MTIPGYPTKQGLYDPRFEHDACGIGFVVNIKGEQSHEIVEQALTVLENLDHRGACGCEDNTGDGAGILLQVPHAFLQHACDGIGLQLPRPGQYGVGMVFLPPDREQRHQCERRLEEIIRREGQEVLGWRGVPTDNLYLGETAKSREPSIRQVFIKRSADLRDDLDFERKLYIIRRQAESAIRYADIPGGDYFYMPSLSYKTLVYKGMLTPRQVATFYPDLTDPLLETALAVVHSRFSTNTFPSWERSHPYRYMIHNGEINTLRGNENWMHARQAMLASELFGDDVHKLFPIIQEDGSDSAKFDNCLEFLVLSGRSLPQAMMMMIPEPWENHESMSDEKRAFYEYHSCLMEPWDGPASIAFTDGIRVGAVLDRNGLRPSRYYVTRDDLVIMASEVGVLDVPPERVLIKQRLQPGRMFLVDTEEGRIISDAELKQTVAKAQPYRQWLQDHLVDFEALPEVYEEEPKSDHRVTLRRQQVFGYSFEDLRVNIGPMALAGIQPVGSMGTDTPLAVLSEKPQLLYNYFKQLFAQVTNPPIDPIREELITSTFMRLGSEGNLLRPEPSNCHQIKLQHPILRNGDVEKLRQLDRPGFKVATLPILFKVADGEAGLEQALNGLYQAAEQAMQDGVNILILSDRTFDRNYAPIPALLASAGLHHHLIRAGTRTRVGLVLESGEPREVHHFCLLLGYGVQAINPYMAYETLYDMINQGLLTNITYEKAVYRLYQGRRQGRGKGHGENGHFDDSVVLWRPDLRSRRAQSGVRRALFYLDGLPRGWHRAGRKSPRKHSSSMPEPFRSFRSMAIRSMCMVSISTARTASCTCLTPAPSICCKKPVAHNDYATFKDYARLIDEQAEHLATLRGLFELKYAREPVPLDEVESVRSHHETL